LHCALSSGVVEESLVNVDFCKKTIFWKRFT